MGIFSLSQSQYVLNIVLKGSRYTPFSASPRALFLPRSFSRKKRVLNFNKVLGTYVDLNLPPAPFNIANFTRCFSFYSGKENMGVISTRHNLLYILIYLAIFLLFFGLLNKQTRIEPRIFKYFSA